MTREELRGIVEGITDEQLKKILDIHSQDIGRAKNAQEAIQAELEKAKVCSAEMEKEISRLKDGQCEADIMKAKIDELQKVIDQNRQAEEERLAEDKLRGRFDEVSGNCEFVNDLTRTGVYREFCTALADAQNAGRSDAELYASVVENRENLFAPGKDTPSIIGTAIGFGEGLTEGDVREIMGLN